MEEKLDNMLVRGAAEFGVPLDRLQAGQLMKYSGILKEWNEKINLTAIEEDKDIIIKHFIDSLSILPYIKDKNASLIDVGTGAGFPGIPLKVVLNTIKVTLLDSLEKRVKFLNLVIKTLDLGDISAVHGRAEDYGQNPAFREKFDISVARAVASLPVLLEYCLPFVKPGGIFIAMKGSNIEEVGVSKKALETLGGKIEEVREMILPFSDIKRSIIIVTKLRQTSTQYPRKAGKPSKNPLA